MGRLIAIDYGSKRSGIAVSDEGQVFAFPHDTVSTSNLIDYLSQYMRHESVDGIVVGLPKRLHNEPSSITNEVSQFVDKCKRTFPLVQHYTYDERFTSKIASHEISRVSTKKQVRQNKSLIDKVSATLLLQSFITHQQAKTS